jgi:hypothetical protein
MAEDDLFWAIMCLCYFVGGLTIGWWFNEWKHRKNPKRSGTGRWDYSNKTYKGDDRYK